MEYIKKADAISWGILGAIVLVTYLFFSDGEFSLIFTLAGTVQAFGFGLIVMKIRKSRSVSGLSRETFICYAIIFTIRSIIFIFFKVLAVFYAGVPALRPLWGYDFQTPGSAGYLLRFLHPVCHLRALQDQLQPRPRHRQKLLPHRFCSSRRHFLPFQPQPVPICRLWMGLHTVP